MAAERKCGGRPAKRKNILGCSRVLQEHVKSVAGKSRYSDPLTIDRVFPPSHGLSIEDFTCKICGNVYNQPIELPCKEVMCYECCLSRMRSNAVTMPCPSCSDGHPYRTSTFQAPSPVIVKLIDQLILRCNRCTAAVQLQDLQEHLDGGCKSSSITHSLTVEQILSQPMDIPPTRIELETAGHLVRKLLLQTTDNSFSVPTGGCVSIRT